MSENKMTPVIRFDGFNGGWQVQNLATMVEHLEYGLNAAAKEYDGKNKYLRITDIDDVSRDFQQAGLTSPGIAFEVADNYLLCEGDVLFARTGASVGKTYRYRTTDGKVYFAGFLIRARVSKEYDSEFIFQNTLTAKYRKFVHLTSQRSGQPGINAQEYSSYEIMIPYKPEQTAIGNFFRNLDDAITLAKQQHEKTMNIKKAMLEKMLPQKGATIPEIRFDGFTKAWFRYPLGEVTTKIGSGKTPSGGSSVYLQSGIPLIRSQNITNDRVDFSDVVHISDAMDEEMANSRVQEMDVLLNITGASIGRSAVYGSESRANVNQHVCIIRPDKGVNAFFIQLHLTSANGQQQIDDNQAGGAREGLNFQQIAKISFSFASKEEQAAISIFFRNIDDLIEAQRQDIEKLHNIKNACLNKMFV